MKKRYFGRLLSAILSVAVGFTTVIPSYAMEGSTENTEEEIAVSAEASSETEEEAAEESSVDTKESSADTNESAADTNEEEIEAAIDQSEDETTDEVSLDTEDGLEENEEEIIEEEKASKLLGAGDGIIIDANGGEVFNGTEYAGEVVATLDETYIDSYYIPEKEGYVFTGFYAEASCENLLSSDKANYLKEIPADGTRIYAGWTNEYWTVTLDYNGGEYTGSDSAEVFVPKGKTLRFADIHGFWYNVDAPEGRAFNNKWTLDPEGKTDPIDYYEYVPEDDANLYAQYTGACTITYNAGDGYFYDVHFGRFNLTYSDDYRTLSGIVPEGTKLDKKANYVGEAEQYQYIADDPVAPKGKVFKTWCTDAELKNEISVEEIAALTMTGDMTFYAKYEDAENGGDTEGYIIIDANGGEVFNGTDWAGETAALVDGITNEISSVYIPEREGYVFNGFYAEPSCETELSSGKSNYLKEMPEAGTRIYAGWSKEYWTVTLNANGGSFRSGWDEENDVLVPKGRTVKFADTEGWLFYVLAPDGMAFENKWTKDAEGKDPVDYSTYVPEADITLYAQFSGTYSISYNAGQGSFDDERTGRFDLDYSENHRVLSGLVPEGTKLSKTARYVGEAYKYQYIADDPKAPEGKVFKTWCTDAGLKNEISVEEIAALTMTKDMTFYAKYEEGPDSKHITFDANGGYYLENGERSSFYKISSYDDYVSWNIPQRDGFAFTGYYSDKECTNLLSSSHVFYLENAPALGDVIYAGWTEDFWYVWLNPNGGEFSGDLNGSSTKEIRVPKGEKPIFYDCNNYSTNVVGKDNYTFSNEWALDPAGETGRFSIFNYVPEGNVLLYAQFNEVSWRDVTEADKDLFYDPEGDYSVNPPVPDARFVANSGLVMGHIGEISQTYTGDKITFDDAFNVYYNGFKLVRGKDYKVTYTNNVKAFETTGNDENASNVNKQGPKVTVTGIGSYSGTQSKSFAIFRRSITEAAITSNMVVTAVSTDKKIAPVPTVKMELNGKTVALKAGTDFEVFYNRITYNENGSRSIDFTKEYTADEVKANADTYKNYLINIKGKKNSNFKGTLVEKAEDAARAPELVIVGKEESKNLLFMSKAKVGKIAKQAYAEDADGKAIALSKDIIEKIKSGEITVKIGSKDLIYKADNEAAEVEGAYFAIVDPADTDSTINRYPGSNNYITLRATVMAEGSKDKNILVGDQKVFFTITGDPIDVKYVKTSVEYTGNKLLAYSGEAVDVNTTLKNLFAKSAASDKDGADKVKVFVKSGVNKGTVLDPARYNVYAIDDNGAAGTVQVVFEGNPERGTTGKITKKIKVTAKKIKAEDVDVAFAAGVNKDDVPYSKAGAKPPVAVTYNEAALTEGTDFTVSYKSNTKVGATGKVSIKLKGNYSGSLNNVLTFKVGKAVFDNSLIEVQASDKAFKANAGKDYFKVKPVLYESGKKLALNTDYSYVSEPVYFNADTNEAIADTDVVPAGTRVKVTFTAKPLEKSSYKAAAADGGVISFSQTYRIGYDISKVKVKVANQAFAGADIAVIPSKDDITITPAKNAPDVTAANYTVVSVTNNTKVGKAKMVIRGTGIYCGTKTVTFKIVKGTVKE